MLVFFFTSSKLTKLGSDRKKRIEADYEKGLRPKRHYIDFKEISSPLCTRFSFATRLATSYSQRRRSSHVFAFGSNQIRIRIGATSRSEK